MKKTFIFLALLLTSIASKTKALAEAFSSNDAFVKFCEKVAKATGYSTQRVKNYLIQSLSPETLPLLATRTGISVEQLRTLRTQWVEKNGIVALTDTPTEELNPAEMSEMTSAIMRHLVKTEVITREYVSQQAPAIAKNAYNIDAKQVTDFFTKTEAQLSAPIFGVRRVSAN